MRAISLSDLEAKVSPAEASRLKREIMVAMLNRKGEWLDKELKKLLPRSIYRMAHDESAPFEAFEKRQETVRKWMKDHDIRLEEQGLNARLFRGREKISAFYVKLAEK